MPVARNFEAIVLDVDGTLYRPGPVRRGMAAQLLAAASRRPLRTRRAVRVIRNFRRSLEALRHATAVDQPAEQLRRTAEISGLSEDEVRPLVEEWMLERPLAAIGSHPRKGLHQFLERAHRKGVRLGVFSEYPCSDKLESLGIRERFEAVVSSHDAEVRRFKPDPTGFLHAARLLRSPAEKTLVIGDRADADGAGANAAGMAFLLIGGAEFPSFDEVVQRLFADSPRVR